MHTSLNHFYIIKGDNGVIRENLFQTDQGYCSHCGVYDEDWQADHIVPVSQGGGGCTLENLQTLCNDCHKVKTRELYRVPYSNNVLTPSFNIVPSTLNAGRAFYETIRIDVVRNAMVRARYSF
ncbi:MAG: hypothetical protein GQ574_04825 [Crocinitomix sp.]|nr:hypothetical protein [Crocinitomix sp.]